MVIYPYCQYSTFRNHYHPFQFSPQHHNLEHALRRFSSISVRKNDALKLVMSLQFSHAMANGVDFLSVIGKRNICAHLAFHDGTFSSAYRDDGYVICLYFLNGGRVTCNKSTLSDKFLACFQSSYKPGTIAA